MNYFITPTPRHMARHWARMAAQDGMDSPHPYKLSINLREQKDAYVLNALVPGLRAENLNIQVLEDVVTIDGEYKGEENEYLIQELPQGAFRRSLRLPASLDASNAQAHISDGILTLTLPKAESARPKTIKIAVK